ncbi:MAG: NAD(P)/FAD-dependent oxidoreductase [Treponema sp.]|jgi:NADPH-dependent 2,4-dienoyl-CoA reductase/sulfur reductase-like enzyme|nr:NAD(P)/FAD-dependent oxidoreductase [Treponema sp.]
MEREQSADYELAVIGGGPAGLAAALEAFKRGLRKIIIIERDKELGGILNQCIHNGFGLHYFKEELTGPEYSGRFITKLEETLTNPVNAIEISLDTMALDIVPESGGAGAGLRGVCTIHLAGKTGYRVISAASLVLAMGCRERTRGALAIPGTRPSGIFTAGAAQRFINMEGRMVGRKIIILGSGDIGLIMARRLTLEGAEVPACIELLPYPGGLTRNIVQCLNDYNIPLYLSHTVTEIRGRRRVEGVTVSRVDENRRIIAGTETRFDCDTLLLSVGLIPENELSRKAGISLDPRTKGPEVTDTMETSVSGIFACGNVVHVHDLVDFVSAEGERAGAAAADYVLRRPAEDGAGLVLKNGDGVSYTVPQFIKKKSGRAEIFFRVRGIYRNGKIGVYSGKRELISFKRAHMAPGEMESIVLSEEILSAAEKEICVRAGDGA